MKAQRPIKKSRVWRMTVALGTDEDRKKLYKRACYLDTDSGTIIRVLLKAFLDNRITIHYETNGSAVLFQDDDDE
jgi:hypothetical protein